MDKYVFRRYSPDYPRFFRTEKARLGKVLGPSARVEHIGSTAVPGLGGKGILDVMVGVSAGKIQSSKKKLEGAGYLFRPAAGEGARLFFRRDSGKRRIHVHLMPFNCADWREKLAFRNYLRGHPEAAAEYAKLKKAAVRKARGNREVYLASKERFIDRIVRKARDKT